VGAGQEFVAAPVVRGHRFDQCADPRVVVIRPLITRQLVWLVKGMLDRIAHDVLLLVAPPNRPDIRPFGTGRQVFAHAVKSLVIAAAVMDAEARDAQGNPLWISKPYHLKKILAFGHWDFPLRRLRPYHGHRFHRNPPRKAAK